jgi:hypothetical protein
MDAGFILSRDLVAWVGAANIVKSATLTLQMFQERDFYIMYTVLYML